MTIDNNQQLAFFNLLQAGLWEDVSMISNLSIPQNVDWAALYHLAEKQGVVGLVAAGLDRMKVNIPKTWALQFIGAALQIEQKNYRLVLYLRTKHLLYFPFYCLLPSINVYLFLNNSIIG